MNSFYPAALVVLCIGLGVMGVAYVMPADDCTPGYAFDATPTDDPATVEFAALSPEIREAFEGAVADGESGMVSSEAYRAELDGEVVRYEGENYTTSTESVGSCGDDPRAFVFVGGAIVAASSLVFAAFGVSGTLLRRYS